MSDPNVSETSTADQEVTTPDNDETSPYNDETLPDNADIDESANKDLNIKSDDAADQSLSDGTGQVDTDEIPNLKAEPNHSKKLTNGHKNIFFFSEKILQESATKIIQLRNPCLGKPSRYICTDEQCFYEILKINEPNRSWFINDELVSPNGCIYLTTPIDPLFLVIPYLQESASEFYVPYDQIIKDEKYPEIDVLLRCIPDEQLKLIADQKGSADLRATKYNEDKSLLWLKFKCKKLTEELKSKDLCIQSGAKSATFVKSEKLQTNVTEEEYLICAFGMIGEYLSRELGDKLEKFLNIDTKKPLKKAIKSENGPTKRKFSDDEDLSNKRSKSKTSLCDDEDEMGEEDKKDLRELIREEEALTVKKVQPVPEKKTSTREKALKKAATGTKSIMSFFKAK